MIPVPGRWPRTLAGVLVVAALAACQWALDRIPERPAGPPRPGGLR